MHEMGVVLQIVKTANDFALRNGVKEVKKLTLEIGEASAVLPRYVRMFFGDVIPDYPVLANCELEIETVPAQAFCLDCGNVFHPSDEHCENCGESHHHHHHGSPKCPQCGSESFKLLEGNSLMIKNMEVV